MTTTSSQRGQISLRCSLPPGSDKLCSSLCVVTQEKGLARLPRWRLGCRSLWVFVLHSSYTPSVPVLNAFIRVCLEVSVSSLQDLCVCILCVHRSVYVYLQINVCICLFFVLPLPCLLHACLCSSRCLSLHLPFQIFLFPYFFFQQSYLSLPGFLPICAHSKNPLNNIHFPRKVRKDKCK